MSNPYGIVADIKASIEKEMAQLSDKLVSGSARDSITKYHEIVGQYKGLKEALTICTNALKGNDR